MSGPDGVAAGVGELLLAPPPGGTVAAAMFGAVTASNDAQQNSPVENSTGATNHLTWRNIVGIGSRSSALPWAPAAAALVSDL